MIKIVPSKRTALGTILYTLIEGEIHYCLVKRTLGYGMIDIIRGTCLHNSHCFTEVSDLERDALLALCAMGGDERCEGYFAKLWRLVNQKPENSSSNAYKKHFGQFVKNKFIIEKKLKGATSICPFGTWGFPKGGCVGGETEIQTALRETREETKIKASYIIFEPLDPQYEVYKHWNSKYFVGYVNAKFAKDTIIDDFEVSLVAWYNLEDALQLLPIDAFQRRDILLKVDYLLKTQILKKVDRELFFSQTKK